MVSRRLLLSWHAVVPINLCPKISQGFFMSSLKENVNREIRKLESIIVVFFLTSTLVKNNIFNPLTYSSSLISLLWLITAD